MDYFVDGTHSTNTNILEDALDRVMALPIETRRSLALLRELDAKCGVDLDRLKRLQDTHVEVARKKQKDEALELDITETKQRLDQKLEEKVSLATQLWEVVDRHLTRLKKDTTVLEGMLKDSGDLDVWYEGSDSDTMIVPTTSTSMNAMGNDGAMNNGNVGPGALVAASIHVAKVLENGEHITQDEWILARVVNMLPRDKVLVIDVDNANGEQRHTLSRNAIVVLPSDDEDLASARNRLDRRGMRVLAVYPDTTAFYHATLAGLPFKAGPDVVDFHGKICCHVQFQDDEDQTGVNPKRIIWCGYVVGQ